jgi:hypothetical protein
MLDILWTFWYVSEKHLIEFEINNCTISKRMSKNFAQYLGALPGGGRRDRINDALQLSDVQDEADLRAIP